MYSNILLHVDQVVRRLKIVNYVVDSIIERLLSNVVAQASNCSGPFCDEFFDTEGPACYSYCDQGDMMGNCNLAVYRWKYYYYGNPTCLDTPCVAPPSCHFHRWAGPCHPCAS